MTLLATNHNAVMPLSRASTRGRYSRIMGVTKTNLKGEVKEKNHLQEREGVEMIVMNEELSEKQGFGKEGQVIKELHKMNTSSSCW